MPPMVLFDKIINFQVTHLLLILYEMVKQSESIRGGISANVTAGIAEELCYPHPKVRKSDLHVGDKVRECQYSW